MRCTRPRSDSTNVITNVVATPSCPIVPLLLTAVLVAAMLALPARAQDPPVVKATQDLDFDRTESWAMKYFANVTLLTGLGAPRERDPGAVEVGVEALWIPRLDAAQRTVGFDGTKTEDLNKLPAFLRPRVTVGLPGRLSLTGSYVPPVEVEGVRPHLLALALERPLIQRGLWGLGARLYGQTGQIEGSFTCTADDLAAPPGAPGNEFGCQEESSDTYEITYYGFELTGSRRLGAAAGPEVHFGAAANFLDLEFQVDALTFGFRDRTLQRTDGWTYSLTAGARWPLGERSHFTGELFYAPLSVRRPPERNRENDALFNARLMVGFRVR
jgi:hypothetical protein